MRFTKAAFQIAFLAFGLAVQSGQVSADIKQSPATPKPSTSQSNPLDTGIWIGVIHGGDLFPMGRILKGTWVSWWGQPRPSSKSNPPKSWYLNGDGNALAVSQLKKIEISCDTEVWGYALPDYDGDSESGDELVLSAPAKELIDRNKKNWNRKQETGAGESVSWSQLLGIFGFEQGKLTVSESGGYESLGFSVKWEPFEGKKITDHLSAGGC